MPDCIECGKHVRTKSGYRNHFVDKHGGYSEWNKERRRLEEQEKIEEDEKNKRHEQQIKEQNERDQRHKDWLESDFKVTGGELLQILREAEALFTWLDPYYANNIHGSHTPFLDSIILRTKGGQGPH